MLKGKIIEKSKIQKTNTINSLSKAKEAPLRSEKQGKINMNFLTISYTIKKGKDGEKMTFLFKKEIMTYPKSHITIFFMNLMREFSLANHISDRQLCS